MNKTRPCVIALCLLSLGACADRMNNGSPSGSNNGSNSAGAGYGSGAGGSAMTGSGSTGGSMGTAGSASQQAGTTYGVVQAIDQLQRQDVGAMGSVGAAAAGGSGSAGSPTDKVYRVTVRLDDGSTHMQVLESQPGYKIGDRVRYSNGSVQTY